jgi:hypothetical protein
LFSDVDLTLRSRKHGAVDVGVSDEKVDSVLIEMTAQLLHNAPQAVCVSLSGCRVVFCQHRRRNQVARRRKRHCSDQGLLPSTRLKADEAALIGRLWPSDDSDACQFSETSPGLKTSRAVVIPRDDDSCYRSFAYSPKKSEDEAFGLCDGCAIVENVAGQQKQVDILAGSEVRETAKHSFKFVEAS